MLLNQPGQAGAATGRIVVIGSGAVGLYAANELVRRGRDVLVIESGGIDLGNFPAESYDVTGRGHEGIELGRSRCLGGTTNLWGGQLVEFQPVDFVGRDWLPESRWPLSYEDVQPYYARTYENLGFRPEAQHDGPVFDHFLGSTPALGEDLEVFLTRWLKVPSFSVFYARQIRESSRLGVLLNHTAVGFDCLDGAIRAVRVVDSQGREHRVEGECFVLAAGTIEISRLLLHSARQDTGCPWRDNPNLGAYFQDHLGGKIAAVHPLNRRRFLDTFSTMVWSGHKYAPKLRLKNEALGQLRILNMYGTFAFESSIEENLVYLKQFLKAAIYSRRISGVGDFLRNLRACGQYLVPLMWKYVVDNRVFVPGISRTSLVFQGEHVPMAESRIRIDGASIDRSGLPRVVLDWKLDGEEVLSIREFALRCDRALQAGGLARLDIPTALMQGDAAFLTTLRDTNHQSGGARMGVSERDGVVDRDLRVFGTQNLYVVGAATFRTTSNANTTFTALTLVTRLADHLVPGHAAG